MMNTFRIVDTLKPGTVTVEVLRDGKRSSAYADPYTGKRNWKCCPLFPILTSSKSWACYKLETSTFSIVQAIPAGFKTGR